VISILKLGKDPALPSSYRPISLLDTIGKLFEKILLAGILHEVNVRGLLRNEQFGFRPEHSTSLQLTRLVERITRKFGEKRLTGTVFLDVAKAFDTVWIDGLLYKQEPSTSKAPTEQKHQKDTGHVHFPSKRQRSAGGTPEGGQTKRPKQIGQLS